MSNVRDSEYLPRRRKSSANLRSRPQIATRFDAAKRRSWRSFAVRSRTTREDSTRRSDASNCGASTVVASRPTRSRTAPDVALSLVDGTGQGILGPRALGLGMSPEREQAQEARRHGDREDGQQRRERRPAPAPATGVFELRDRPRPDREPIEPAPGGRRPAPRPRRIAAAGPSAGRSARSFRGHAAGRGPAFWAGRARGCAPGRASRSPTRPGTEDARSRGCTALPRGRRRRIADRSRRGRRQSVPGAMNEGVPRTPIRPVAVAPGSSPARAIPKSASIGVT